MEKISWAYISAIGSLIIGWALNELGQWFRTRKEDKKIVKKVLYNLLETHYTFNLLNTSDIPKLFEQLTIRIPDPVQREAIIQGINQYLPSLKSGEFIQDNVEERLQRIEIDYTNAVNELATVDPIIAYRLNGKTKILQTFEILHKSLAQVKDQSPDNQQQIQNRVESAIEIIKPVIVMDAIKDLEYEIKSLSCSINIKTWYKAKKTITRTRNRLNIEGDKRISELLDKILPK